MESQPPNPEFRINPENFHPYSCQDPCTDRIFLDPCSSVVFLSKKQAVITERNVIRERIAETNDQLSDM